jgi:hypothetical protein
MTRRALLADIAPNSAHLLEGQPSLLSTRFRHDLQVHGRESILLKVTRTDP